VCSRSGSTRDLPTIALFRAGALLRRNGPVGILAAHRPGAIMDKSRRRFVIRLDALWGSTRKAPTKTSITLPFQDSSRKNKNSNHCSAEDAKVLKSLNLSRRENYWDFQGKSASVCRAVHSSCFATHEIRSCGALTTAGLLLKSIPFFLRVLCASVVKSPVSVPSTFLFHLTSITSFPVVFLPSKSRKAWTISVKG